MGAIALTFTLATAEGKCGNAQQGMMNNDGKCGDAKKGMMNHEEKRETYQHTKEKRKNYQKDMMDNDDK